MLAAAAEGAVSETIQREMVAMVAEVAQTVGQEWEVALPAVDKAVEMAEAVVPRVLAGVA